MSSEYSLQVIRLEGFQWKSRLHSRTPRLFVEVQLANITKRTSLIKSKAPTWNETMKFSSGDTSMSIAITVKQQSFFPSGKIDTIGSVEIELGELASKCASGETELSLCPPSGTASSISAGVIYLQLKGSSLTSRATEDVEAVKGAIQRSGINRLEIFADSTTAARLDTVVQTPQRDLYQSIGNLCGKLDNIVKAIDDISKIVPYVHAAWNVVSAMYKSISNQFETDKKVVLLVDALVAAFDFASDTETLRRKTRTVESRIIRLLDKTIECCQFLQEYLQHGFAGRMLDLTASQKVEEYRRELMDFRIDLDSSLNVHKALILERISEKTDVQYLQQILNIDYTVPPARKECLEGTRIGIRQTVVGLLRSESGPRMIWLHGVAGSGKSTIATTTENFFRDISQLGAFLQFERGKSEPNSVIRTIAFKLALFDSSLCSLILENVNKDKDIASALVFRQFEKLLLEPLNALHNGAERNLGSPVVVVLDALDECGTPETRKDLMRLMKNDFPRLPSNIRFFMTSRPENDIVNALSACENPVHKIELDYTSDDSRHDVLSYLNHEMRRIVVDDWKVKVPVDWLWDSNMASLSEAAGGLFIWASTAVKLVQTSDNPFRKLKGLVSDARSLNHFGLDELYASVLRSSGIVWDDEESRSRFSKVLALLLFSRVPLSDETIDGLLGFPADEPSHLILSRVRSLLAYTPGEPVRLFHASFADYLQSPGRCNDPWFIDVVGQKHLLATRCFVVMEDTLHFDMCNLETSFAYNNSVTDLEDRIKERITAHVEYACVHWSQHLRDVPFSPCLLEKLRSFAYERLLFWFEVLSLLKKLSRIGSRALLDAVVWLEEHEAKVSSFLEDAAKLARTFAAPVTQSTPHLYVSMLPLMKEESKVAAHYSRQASSMVRVDCLGTKSAPLSLKVFEGHTDDVKSVSFSPDGRRIISGSADRTIKIWDVESGDLLSECAGHLGAVSFVVFSSDGQSFASGSWDKTVRIWDTETGTTIYGPLEGHTAGVWEVALSPVGTHVASGSEDKTIRLWDLENDFACTTIEGHTSGVGSVAFSPDGRRIVSGSDDSTIRIWNVQTGQIIAGPFEGHTGGILTASFLPDGTHVMSGSWDGTARFWDIESGEAVCVPLETYSDSVTAIGFPLNGACVASGSRKGLVQTCNAKSGEIESGPFEGHTDWINSVVFSPDGTRVATASSDKTIRIWDAANGKVEVKSRMRNKRAIRYAFSARGTHVTSGSLDNLVSVWDIRHQEAIFTTFSGHAEEVHSVAFSPDGTRIASGSQDKTVIVWDVETGNIVSGPFKGHTGSVWSVTFSPDGTRIASGCSDKTLYIWVVDDGAIAIGPLRKHTSSVSSLAFSPDGKRIASGSRDTTILIWDVMTGDAVSGPFRGHEANIESLAFAPDGMHIASGSWDKTVRVWNAETGQVVCGPLKGHSDLIYCVGFSPDGSRVVSGSKDRTMVMWDASTGDIIFGPFEAHSSTVQGIAFCSDGMRITTGSWDTTIKIWDVERVHLAWRLLMNWSEDTSQETFAPTAAADDEQDHRDCATWVLAESGWILGPKRELLLWVPPDIRPTLWRPQNVAVFGCDFSTRLDFRGVVHGRRWRKCFNPNKG